MNTQPAKAGPPFAPSHSVQAGPHGPSSVPGTSGGPPLRPDRWRSYMSTALNAVALSLVTGGGGAQLERAATQIHKKKPLTKQTNKQTNTKNKLGMFHVGRDGGSFQKELPADLQRHTGSGRRAAGGRAGAWPRDAPPSLLRSAVSGPRPPGGSGCRDRRRRGNGPGQNAPTGPPSPAASPRALHPGWVRTHVVLGTEKGTSLRVASRPVRDGGLHTRSRCLFIVIFNSRSDL